LRELIIGAYRLVYLVERKRVLIVAVLHGHRALRRALKDRLWECTTSPIKGMKGS
jgi:plasmid stabilization system protein ParE